MHHDTFNADFYVTTATVIPVLYLALTLQGSTFENMMTRWRALVKDSPWKLVPQLRVITAAFIAIAGGIIVIFSVYAEFQALRALDLQQSTHVIQSNVFNSTISLLAVTVAGPAYRFLWAFFGTLTDDFGQ